MKQLVSVIVLVLALMLTSASAQALWGGTTYGMSPEQVLEVVPGARMVNDGVSLSSGARELVRVDKVEIVERDFVARFFFLENELRQITLSLLDPGPFAAELSTFESLTKELRDQYDAEINLEIARGSEGIADALWISGKTNISLVLLRAGDNPAKLNLVFSQ